MDVFVTGATGQLGRSTIPLLLRAGHRVRGLARSESNLETIRAMGAEPVPADLFDVESLRPAVRSADAILHLATRIPPVMRAGWRSAWRENDRIRRDGTRNLVDAALAEGIQAVLYPSVTFLYPDSGDRWIEAGLTPRSTPMLQSTLEAEAEVDRFARAGGRGVVLRFGAFYGPDSPATEAQMALARRGFSPIPGAPQAYLSSIWIPDTGSAVATALERAPAGLYDVVDDEPMRREEVVGVLARAMGKPRLRSVPPALFSLMAPAVGRMLMRSQRVSNHAFKQATGWQPAVAGARIGLPLLVSGTWSSRSEPDTLPSIRARGQM